MSVCVCVCVCVCGICTDHFLSLRLFSYGLESEVAQSSGKRLLGLGELYKQSDREAGGRGRKGVRQRGRGEGKEGSQTERQGGGEGRESDREAGGRGRKGVRQRGRGEGKEGSQTERQGGGEGRDVMQAERQERGRRVVRKKGMEMENKNVDEIRITQHEYI